MRLMDFYCKAGEPAHQWLTGRFLRVLSGKGRLKVHTDNGHSGPLITGLGVDLLNKGNGNGFEQVTITSEVDQVVTVLASDFPSTDSRLSGDVDINGLLSVVNAGGSGWASSVVALNAATPGHVLVPFNPERLNLSIQSDVDMWIGADATVTDSTGIRISAGATLNAENTAPIHVFTRANGTARVMESIK